MLIDPKDVQVGDIVTSLTRDTDTVDWTRTRGGEKMLGWRIIAVRRPGVYSMKQEPLPGNTSPNDLVTEYMFGLTVRSITVIRQPSFTSGQQVVLKREPVVIKDWPVQCPRCRHYESAVLLFQGYDCRHGCFGKY